MCWEFFFFTTESRPALGPTQPPSQWILRFLSPGVKRAKREADISPLSSAEVKNVSSWLGALLCRGTTLPFTLPVPAVLNDAFYSCQ